MQTMKPIIPAMLGIALLTMFAVACEGDEPSVHELVGTWKSTSETTYYGASIDAADSTDVDANHTGETLLFDADGSGSNTVTDENETFTSEFTWSTSGTTLSLTIEFDDITFTIPVTYDISGSTLTLTSHEEADPDFDDPEQWTVTKYTKQ